MYRSESAINAKVIIELDPKILNSIHRAIELETYYPSSDRSRTTINIDRDQIELNTEDNELIRAARSPPATRPLKPTGRSVFTNVGKA